ncbi:helix-turn-helix domain-containing protein [Coxiella endosymbiont of Amblyomma americanum]|uniref:helix-turn-helix domain-containing protein n=1 Tax=Coxiella endosymbiont of Amblyomma americanum TaxID=325775 RepID=UPI00068FBB5A|nr:helix-turn-helix domain-containing protein [Coxiella endosymbiont of Amblyomma americanum]AUJ58855.1 transcriptional regulator [Coxiella-like endosymbiont of Amblyomma americanum]
MTEENIKINVVSHNINEDKRTPGTLLREARQAKNLQQDEIAKQMHLSVQWIKNLEKDDYSQAPAIIYIRGYLRSYARCVGLAPEEVIAAFDNLALNETFKQTRTLEKKSMEYKAIPVIVRSTRMITNRKVIFWVTFLALAVLVALVDIWWHGKKHFEEQNHQQILATARLNQDVPA